MTACLVDNEKEKFLHKRRRHKKMARLLNGIQNESAQFGFWRGMNFVWIRCTSEAQNTVRNSTQCYLLTFPLEVMMLNEKKNSH